MKTLIAALIYPIALVADDRSGHRWTSCVQGAEDMLNALADLLDTLSL